MLDIERELVGLEEGLDGDLERLVKATQLAEYSNRSSGVLKEVRRTLMRGVSWRGDGH